MDVSSDTVVNSVYCVSGVPFDEGSQKCHIGPKLFDQLNLKLGASLLIKRPTQTVICKAWVRPDKKNDIIDFDDTVFLETDLSSPDTLDSKCNRIDVINLCQVKTTAFKQITVHVIVSNYNMLFQIDTNPLEINEMIFQLLEGKYITKSCIVICRMINSLIHCIYVSTASHPSYGFITGATKITVDRVISKERFECQRQRRYIQLGGLDRELSVLKHMIEVPLKQGNALRELCRVCPKSVLLHGPPGCGKSSLAMKAAQECQAVLIPVRAADLIGARAGESEQALRQVFKRACAHSREGFTIMLFDEIDVFCNNKKSGDSRLLTQLTHILDQVGTVNNLVVIGTTNRLAVLDPLLRRPGRFDREILVGMSAQNERECILNVLTSGMQLDGELDLKLLASATPGYAGADLRALLQQAYYAALERTKQQQEAIVVTSADITAALHITIPSCQRANDTLVRPSKPINWTDIGGLETVKAQLKQAIELPLTHPEAFIRLGLSRPKGVLLYGPPGCAKTTLVRAAATSCHVTFLSISGAQLYSPFVGDSEKKIAEVFQQARAGAPCILFIDEIDSVVGSRSKDSHKQGSVQERVLSTLLNEMDGVGLRVDKMQTANAQKQLEAEGQVAVNQSNAGTIAVDNSDVLVVAATNRPDMLDDALLRPGRFDKIIYVPTPDKQARIEILKIHTSKMASIGSLDLGTIANKTENFSGADLENLCREAALCALSMDGLDVATVTQKHFDHVLTTISPSLSSTQLQAYQELKFR